MGRKRIGAATIAVLTGTTALAVGTARPALAESSHVIAIQSIGDMIVDGVHQRLFITDPASGKVLATDYSGNELGSALVTNATNLALSTDSSRLYVTSPKGLAVFALDTTTLAPTAEYSTGAVAPKDVAVAGGRIWFSYANGIPGNLGTIDPAAETPTVLLDRFETGWTGVAELATASAAPNRLGVAALGKTAILDVSGDTVTTVGSVLTNQSVTDMAIFPDGNRIATIQSGNITLRDADAMATPRTLPSDPYPVAVDIATDGTIVGGHAHFHNASELHLFTSAGKPIKQVDIPNLGYVAGHGVAWEPNGNRLFVVSSSGVDGVSLRIYPDARQAPSTLSLSGPPMETVPGASVTLTGKLRSAMSLPAGISVSISRNGTTLGTATVGADGSFTFADTPPTTEGTVTYQASYAGDDYHAPATTTALIWVARVRSYLALAGPSTAVPGAPVTITGTLASSVSLPAGISLSVSRAGTSLNAATVSPDGSFTFADTPPTTEGTVTYQISYAGDGTHLPATATTSVEVSRTASALTLTGPSSAPRARPLTITGKLASPLALPAGTRMSISRTDLDHPAGTSLGSKTVGSGGVFSFTDTPTAGGTVTYRVSYAGDTTHTPASAAKSVAVSRVTSPLTLTNNGKVYAYGQKVSFTAHLGPTYKNRTVEIWADPSGQDQARRLLRRGAVNSAGNLAASIRLTRDTTVSVVFTGDSRTTPRTLTVAVGTKVGLSLRMSNQYKVAKIGGKTYLCFRAKKGAHFGTWITDASHRMVYVVLERYDNGRWRTIDNRYFPPNERLYLSGSGLKGVKLRLTAAYVRGGSGDRLNTPTRTPYQYFTFTK